MSTSRSDLIECASRVAERSHGWRVVRRTGTVIQLCHSELTRALPPIGAGENSQDWWSLTFQAHQTDYLGMYWHCDEVTDADMRRAVLSALVAAGEQTGIVKRTGAVGDDGAYSGESISGEWWNQQRGVDLALAEVSITRWLEHWAARVPAMVAAIRGIVQPPSAVGTEWSDDEARAAVAAYFVMMDLSRRAESFVKRRHIEELMARTRGRSRQSCEFKLRNISAVMREMGLAYLPGYVPADNFQQRLADLVAEHLDEDSGARGAAEALLGVVPAPASPSVPMRSEIEEDPPEPVTARPPGTKRGPVVRLVVNVGVRDAANRDLGKAGERFVVDLERAELIRAGRPDLAERVRWVADVDGDGLGYDVLSFSPEGEERFIEVKTTNGSKAAPFFVTANEVAVSARCAEKFRLYRVFEFASEPKLYIQRGSLSEAFCLDPVVWRAGVREAAP